MSARNFKSWRRDRANLSLLTFIFPIVILTETLPGPVVEVQILDPYHPQETLDDKLTIVDVNARDAAGQVFKIEIQRDDWTRHRCGSYLTAPDAPTQSRSLGANTGAPA
ncbi:PD-(D/E)XK nuclease family transposase [Thiocapsa bogorovii]|uniref:PD-(D/E)XK nuclease family transposase n=1 Tax=Thiocapsa bogorovii TaxID=521689 RepID=UPI001E54031D|nr:PD-(D/E)XK nuclease family transposase [Thiocapsa bogorovii]UHD16870.1 PD-(D/E)XK nuclease family transposase [Thiocapsa bogorovii]